MWGCLNNLLQLFPCRYVQVTDILQVKHIPGKNSVVCLEHALALLDKGNSSQADIDLELRCAFSDQQIQDTLDTIAQRLDDL